MDTGSVEYIALSHERRGRGGGRGDQREGRGKLEERKNSREWEGYGGGEGSEEKGGRRGWYTSKKGVTWQSLGQTHL